jgi:hypothetical protein
LSSRDLFHHLDRARFLIVASHFAIVAVCFATTPSFLCAADHVIHISVDGLHPGHLQTQINASVAPHFKRFQDEGAWTNNARTDYTRTNTLPNHTSMITGRPVSLPTGMPAMTHHGYTENDTPPTNPPETLHNFTSPDWYKASAFDVVHDADKSTAMYASKIKFRIFEQSYDDTHGAPHPNGNNKIDTYVMDEATAVMQEALLSDLADTNFNYTFVHYADLDDAGHFQGGWGSPAYMEAIVTVDNYLGQLFNLVETDPDLVGRTAIILSADHGGTGTGHSTASIPANYTIPFYVWGAGVAHGDLYALNDGTRMNPGTGRPDYNASGQPIRNGDGGNLALDLLGLGGIPNSLINSAQNLLVSTPGDFNLDDAVNAADYVLWRKGVDLGYSPFSYSVWRANFAEGSTGVSSPGPTNVPEPTTVILLLMCAAFAVSSLCRRAA